MSGFDILAAILAQRRQPVASVIALDPLCCWSMRLATHRRTDRASKMADKYGTFSLFFFGMQTAICPGQYSPNTCPMTEFSGFA